MSPSTVKLIEQLIRLGKGMCTACDVWLLEQKAQDRLKAENSSK